MAGGPVDIIGIIGAGTMGAGIAQVAASHGHNVVLYDVQAALAQRGLEQRGVNESRFSKPGQFPLQSPGGE